MPAEDHKAAEHHRRLAALFFSAEDCFKHAVNAFNANPQDSATLQSCLSDTVIICKIGDGSQATSNSQAAVLTYLTTPAPGLQGCQFKPYKNDKHVSPTKIHGLASWVDNDNSANDVLKYSFDFDPVDHRITKFFAGDT